MSDAGVVSGAGKGRKVLLQLVMGGACGAAGMAAGLWLFEGQGGTEVDAARAVAIGTTLVFGLTALFVSLGVVAPGLGAKTLNVEDREELEEQRSTLLVGAVGFFLVALLLGALTLGGNPGDPGLLGSRGTALAAAAATLALIAWSILHRDKGDEMMRAANKDAGAITAQLLFLIFGVWAGAAHLGIVPMFDPLMFVAGYSALYLVAVFIAVGRRGLLAPR